MITFQEQHFVTRLKNLRRKKGKNTLASPFKRLKVGETDRNPDHFDECLFNGHPIDIYLIRLNGKQNLL